MMSRRQLATDSYGSPIFAGDGSFRLGYSDLRGLGAGQMGPLYTCADGSQVFNSSSCPEGAAQGSMSITDQLQAEIDALYQYTGAGQASPTGSGVSQFFSTYGLPLAIGAGVVLLAKGMR
jgi:hypothetical protein